MGTLARVVFGGLVFPQRLLLRRKVAATCFFEVSVDALWSSCLVQRGRTLRSPLSEGDAVPCIRSLDYGLHLAMCIKLGCLRDLRNEITLFAKQREVVTADSATAPFRADQSATCLILMAGQAGVRRPVEISGAYDGGGCCEPGSHQVPTVRAAMEASVACPGA